MKEALTTVYLKHDRSIKSLSKIALSQVVLKIIYLNQKVNGSTIPIIQQNLEKITKVKISESEILETIGILINSDKVNKAKGGSYFIKEAYIPVISTAVSDANSLFENVFNFYFSKSETAKDIIEKWFKESLLIFFENHSSEWINELKREKFKGKKKAPNISETLHKSFQSFSIKEEDREWLKNQFIAFLESLRPEDHLLIWRYSTSMFSSKLISLQKYADKISLDFIRNSKLILDTNILMILDLEAYDLAGSLKILDSILKSLKVKVGYLSISVEEFDAAMKYRRHVTISSFSKYNQKVVNNADCPYIRTALLRQCNTVNDVNTFFNQISSIPEYFSEAKHCKLEKFDSDDINKSVYEGLNDEKLKERLNEINYSLKTKHKENKKLSHDAALLKCAENLFKKENIRILTRDKTLVKFSKENTVRDEPPTTFSIELLLQLLSINGGGVDCEPEHFAPLMANLINHSILSERDIFQVEDLAIILRTENQINELTDERVIELAKGVKKMRFSGTSEEDIGIFLRRELEGDILRLRVDLEQEASDKSLLHKENELNKNKTSILTDELIKEQIEKGRRKLLSKIIRDWTYLITGFVIVALCIYYTLFYYNSSESIPSLILSYACEIGITIIFCAFTWKPKLMITQDDLSIIIKEAKKQVNLLV